MKYTVTLILLLLPMMAGAQMVAPFYIAPSSYSDTFSGSILDLKWTEYDPANCATVTVGSGVMTVAMTGGADHDWYTGINTACRIRQSYSGATNWVIEARFNTTMTAGYTYHGLSVGTDNDNGIRFEVLYDVNGTQYIEAATLAAGTYTSQFQSASSVTAQPYYFRLEKSGTTYTCKYGSNGSSWTTAGSFTWAGAVNQIGVIIGNAGGASAPAFTTTVDSFTYTAQ